MKKLFYAVFLFSLCTMRAMDSGGDPESHDTSAPTIPSAAISTPSSSSTELSPSIIEALKDVDCPICAYSLAGDEESARYVVVDTYFPQNTLHQHCLLASLTSANQRRHPLTREKLDESYLILTQTVQTEIQEFKNSIDRRENVLKRREEELEAIKATLSKFVKRPSLLCCGGLCLGSLVTIIVFVFS